MTDQRIVYEIHCGRAGMQLMDNGAFFYLLDGERVQWAYSFAEAEDGRRIFTKTASMGKAIAEPVAGELGKGMEVTVDYEENGLILKQHIFLPDKAAWISVHCVLAQRGGNVASRKIAPILTPYPHRSGKPLFLSLDQKMILVPYDNDMWVRYESAPLRPGRTSYEVTAVYDEHSLNGMVVGALDHTRWKNGIACSLCDARSITAYSGVADAATHDALPHGCLRGPTVSSARFVMLWTTDVRLGLEEYGDLCACIQPPLCWNGPVPFGFNTFSGLGGNLTLDAWQAAGDLIHTLPNFHDADGATYINLDAAFELDQERLRGMIAAFHARGQKVGTYMAPFIASPRQTLDEVLDAQSGTTTRELLLRDFMGRLLPAPDGLMPLDTTHPAWERSVRERLRGVVEMGFDYLKLDFLSHGAMEGNFYDPAIHTGRMALNRSYRIIREELERSEKPVFLSLSIAPLFPFGFGHARRSCCDSFGHGEDVRYVLNALNFGWWVSGRLYRYNDPDHIVLYRSVIDGREPTLVQEARSRYNAAVISGTVMLLSDDFGPDGDPQVVRHSRERALALADNPGINALARLGKPFRPVELKGEDCEVYLLKDADKWYAALFHFGQTPHALTVPCCRVGLPRKGRVLDMNRNLCWRYCDELAVALAPMDSAILEISPDE